MSLTTAFRRRRYNAGMVRSDAAQFQPALEAKDITRLYKSSGRGISGVSLMIPPGKIFGLMGPNGSGKSTLLRVLSTAIAPDSGSFRVGGVDGLREKRRVRARLGLMVDRPTHYGDLTGRANAYFFARAYGMGTAKAQGAVAELFDFFDLAEYADDRVKSYSYGMGKKLALVEALAHGPEVLLLDEPSLGLDYTSQLAYQRKIQELAAGGVAVLLASNQVGEIESLCDHAAFLHRGKVLAEGTPEELISSVEGFRRVVATLQNPVEYDPLVEVEGVERVVPEGRDLVIHCEERPGIVADVVAGIINAGGDILNLSVEKPNLEDVFAKLSGEALRREA
ncbi:MAG TPA: ABC transporter ATP-binding protein [Rubrobacter sp.]|jgi:ABC-type multidrug transport system ATPase subunit|nr:ABC transporter ATP-binding protein [Rubrobacter sp.]